MAQCPLPPWQVIKCCVVLASFSIFPWNCESDIGHAGWYWVILHHSVINRLMLGRLAKCLENHQLLYLHCQHESFLNSLLYFSENTVGFVLTFLLSYQILQTSNFWPTAVALSTESLSFWRLRKNSPPSSQCVLSLPIFLKTLDKEEWRFSLSSKSLARCLVHHSLRQKCCVSGWKGSLNRLTANAFWKFSTSKAWTEQRRSSSEINFWPRENPVSEIFVIKDVVSSKSVGFSWKFFFEIKRVGPKPEKHTQLTYDGLWQKRRKLYRCVLCCMVIE